jgi:NADPH:quinone reductase-like Zn-dependent oxidoreductase
MAVQLAHSKGAFVAATARGADADFLRRLGADLIIDYETGAFENRVSEVDAVLDTVGGEITERSISVLKRGGVLVSMLGKPDEDLAAQHDVRVVGQNTRISHKRLTRLAELIDTAMVKVHIDRVFPFVEIRAAVAYQMTGRPRSKVVIKIAG